MSLRFAASEEKELFLTPSCSDTTSGTEFELADVLYYMKLK